MDVQTIQKNLQQKNYVNLIPENIQCQTIWAFDNIENKHSLHRWEDCMKKFCTYLEEDDTNVFNFEKKKTLLLTKKGKSESGCSSMFHL